MTQLDLFPRPKPVKPVYVPVCCHGTPLFTHVCPACEAYQGEDPR